MMAKAKRIWLEGVLTLVSLQKGTITRKFEATVKGERTKAKLDNTRIMEVVAVVVSSTTSSSCISRLFDSFKSRLFSHNNGNNVVFMTSAGFIIYIRTITLLSSSSCYYKEAFPHSPRYEKINETIQFLTKS